MIKKSSIIISSILLMLFGLIITYFEPSLTGLSRILYIILLPLWLFSLIPSYVFAIKWLNKKSFEDGMRIGVIWKATVFLVPLLIAPFLMIVYYKESYLLK